jgi:hypothetical protein
MNWEAVFAIGLFCVVFGALLYFPAMWWARRRLAATPPSSEARRRVTAAGLAFTVLVIGLLLFGLAQGRLAPDTPFGRFVGSGVGAVVFFVGMTGIASVIAGVLERLGFTLFRASEHEDGR